MKTVLILGAGLVTRPLVRYLLDQPDFQVVVASRTVSKAVALINDHPRGEAKTLLVQDTGHLKELISQSDLSISLVPWTYHPTVAKLCLELDKPMVTTSYVSDAMRALDQEAKEKKLLFLNEIGLDPGIDHMSAMKIIHGVENRGGHIVSFRSYCGGLPAPEANTNPFGYKFSWSPRGVVLAGKNNGRYLEDGKEVSVPSRDLFAHTWTIEIEGLGELVAYPNRDSIPYIETYGLTDTKTMYRGTLRNPGWCETWKKFVDLGLLDDNERSGLSGQTFAQFMETFIAHPTGNLKTDLAKQLDISKDSEIMGRFEWLGLLSDDPLPVESGSPLDVLAAKLLEKMPYDEGERDMIVLHHEFIAEYPELPAKELITSTLVDYGIPNGDSAMARTVSLPAAVAAKMILHNEIKSTGVHIPVVPEIYEPVLKELEGLGISFKERTAKLTS
jgi:saccharopine dehydrogenase (NADP+, L-glutamate forming)/spermidine synthase